MIKSYYRGHKITYTKNEVWIYSDIKIPVKLYKNRPCGYCNKLNTKEGHDDCFGKLPGLMNACCGHGNIDETYIQYVSGICVTGKEALTIIKKLRKINAC